MIRLRQLIQFPLLVTAISVFSIVAATSVRADGIRAAQREDYGRIVFDWNELVSVERPAGLGVGAEHIDPARGPGRVGNAIGHLGSLRAPTRTQPPQAGGTLTDGDRAVNGS